MDMTQNIEKTRHSRRSSILKKSPSRKSLLEMDINVGLPMMEDDVRRGCKRVSFAHINEVKEISRVSDIAQKWPDPVQNVDTTNLDIPKLTSKRISSELIGDGLNALLMAPIVKNDGSAESTNSRANYAIDFVENDPNNGSSTVATITKTSQHIETMGSHDKFVEENIFDQPVSIPSFLSSHHNEDDVFYEADEKSMDTRATYLSLTKENDTADQRSGSDCLYVKAQSTKFAECDSTLTSVINPNPTPPDEYKLQFGSKKLPVEPTDDVTDTKNDGIEMTCTKSLPSSSVTFKNMPDDMIQETKDCTLLLSNDSHSIKGNCNFLELTCTKDPLSTCAEVQPALSWAECSPDTVNLTSTYDTNEDVRFTCTTSGLPSFNIDHSTLRHDSHLASDEALVIPYCTQSESVRIELNSTVNTLPTSVDRKAVHALSTLSGCGDMQASSDGMELTCHGDPVKNAVTQLTHGIQLSCHSASVKNNLAGFSDDGMDFTCHNATVKNDVTQSTHDDMEFTCHSAPVKNDVARESHNEMEFTCHNALMKKHVAVSSHNGMELSSHKDQAKDDVTQSTYDGMEFTCHNGSVKKDVAGLTRDCMELTSCKDPAKYDVTQSTHDGMEFTCHNASVKKDVAGLTHDCMELISHKDPTKDGMTESTHDGMEFTCHSALVKSAVAGLTQDGMELSSRKDEAKVDVTQLRHDGIELASYSEPLKTDVACLTHGDMELTCHNAPVKTDATQSTHDGMELTCQGIQFKNDVTKLLHDGMDVTCDTTQLSHAERPTSHEGKIPLCHGLQTLCKETKTNQNCMDVTYGTQSKINPTKPSYNGMKILCNVAQSANESMKVTGNKTQPTIFETQASKDLSEKNFKDSKTTCYETQASNHDMEKTCKGYDQKHLTHKSIEMTVTSSDDASVDSDLKDNHKEITYADGLNSSSCGSEVIKAPGSGSNKTVLAIIDMDRKSNDVLQQQCSNELSLSRCGDRKAASDYTIQEVDSVSKLSRSNSMQSHLSGASKLIEGQSLTLNNLTIEKPKVCNGTVSEHGSGGISEPGSYCLVEDQSKQNISKLDDWLAPLSESIQFTKEVSSCISVEDFVRDHMNIRIRPSKQASKRSRRSLIAKRNAIAGGLPDLASGYVQSHTAPMYDQFMELLHKKLDGLEAIVEEKEKGIHLTSSELMSAIRSDKNEGSITERLDHLAINCKKLAKAHWKLPKKKLYKALIQCLSSSIGDLLSIIGCLEEYSPETFDCSTYHSHFEKESIVLQQQEMLFCGGSPSDEQVAEYLQTCREFEELQKQLNLAKSKEAKMNACNKEHRQLLEDSHALVNLKSSKKNQAKWLSSSTIKLLERYFLWKTLHKIPAQCFTFLNGTVIVHCENDRISVDYNTKAATALNYVAVHEFLHRLLSSHFTQGKLNTIVQGSSDIRVALSVISSTLSSAKCLYDDILVVMVDYTHCMLSFDDCSVLVHFFNHKPLSSLKVCFKFCDLAMQPHSDFYPVDCYIIDDGSFFGNINVANINKLLRQTSTPMSFLNLLHALKTIIMTCQ